MCLDYMPTRLGLFTSIAKAHSHASASGYAFSASLANCYSAAASRPHSAIDYWINTRINASSLLSPEGRSNRRGMLTLFALMANPRKLAPLPHLALLSEQGKLNIPQILHRDPTRSPVIQRPFVGDCGDVSSLSAACQTPTQQLSSEFLPLGLLRRGLQGDDSFWAAIDRAHAHTHGHSTKPV